MSNEKLSIEDIKTLVEANILPSNLPESFIKLFIKFCNETNLSPFKRQVHVIGRKQKLPDGSWGDRFTIQIGIDGYRVIADRTGVYAGSDEAVFDDEINPSKATITIYKLVQGVRCPFIASARMKEYKPEHNMIWDKMPHVMLAKCAETLALRKAFPNELSGIYTDEERAQAYKPQTYQSNAGEVVKKVVADNPATPTPKEVQLKKANEQLNIVEIEPSGSNYAMCKKCDKPITSEKVLKYSMDKFNEPLCFSCQAIKKFPSVPKDEVEIDFHELKSVMEDVI